MAIAFKTASQVADEYLAHLKSEKPEADTAQTDSDWWIRSRVTGGVGAGLYADQRKVSTDAFPQSARREAVISHLYTFKGETGLRAATKAVGGVRVTGDIASEVLIGQQFIYGPNQNTYLATANVTLDSSAAFVPIESVSVGQIQNLLDGAELTLSPAPAGIDGTAQASGDLRDGKNEETPEEAVQRILSAIQTPARGGTATDYEQWAYEADDAVASARAIPHFAGLGTMGLAITAGTTDIDTAVDNGIPVVVEPSAELVATVTEYVDSVNPENDCLMVFAGEELEVDVTFRVKFLNGTKLTLTSAILDPEGNPMTQGDIVEREITRAIYKSGVGGRVLNGDTQGYVLASEIEETIDSQLSASAISSGLLAQLVTNRQCEDLSVDGPDLPVDPVQFPVPGTITVLDWDE